MTNTKFQRAHITSCTYTAHQASRNEDESKFQLNEANLVIGDLSFGSQLSRTQIESPGKTDHRETPNYFRHKRSSSVLHMH